MKLEEFKWLFNNLRNPGDIKRLARRGYDKELLLVIYNQKIVRTSTRMFYEVKNRSMMPTVASPIRRVMKIMPPAMNAIDRTFGHPRMIDIPGPI